VDPFGGSWAIEQRTDEIEAEARALIAAIDAAGGTLAAIEAGLIQRQIQDAAYAAQQRIDSGESVVVGVNKFATDAHATIEQLTLDPDSEARQAGAVRRTRAERDTATSTLALRALEVGARGTDNLVPLVLQAVEARATLGEVSDTLRAVFGEHRDHLA
jgi:methylmalonyl-CoA mutase N-terminal domain/subunit